MAKGNKIKPSALAIQILSTFVVIYLVCLTGFIFAWPSYTVANFISNQTCLDRPMTSFEISLFGSLTNIGALITTPFCGYLVNNLGRKYSCMLFGLPYVTAWAIISLTTNVYLILMCMAIAGIGAAGQAVTAVYISEIAEDSIRGGLSSTAVSGFFVGLLASYIMGGYLTYKQVIYTHLTLSVLYLILLMMLKESPVFLLQQGKEEEAAKSLSFYRRRSVTSKEVEQELKRLKLQLDPRIDKILQSGKVTDVDEALQLLNSSTEKEEKTEEISSWKFLKQSKSSQNALIACLIMMCFSIMMGTIVLQVYAEPLMKEAAPSIPSNLAAILLAVDFLAASAMCSFIIDRFGRKILTTTTAAGSALLTLLLGLQIQYHFAPNWVTVIFVYGFAFVYSIGAGVTPYILTAEVFLPEVRGLCNSLTAGCMWLMNFITLFLFDPLVRAIGLGFVFCLFSAVCALCAIYSHLCLPETKGLSADEIQLLFLNNSNEKNKSGLA